VDSRRSIHIRNIGFIGLFKTTILVGITGAMLEFATIGGIGMRGRGIGMLKSDRPIGMQTRGLIGR
jgi:hypothetical protein